MKFFSAYIIFALIVFQFSFVILKVSSCKPTDKRKSASNQNLSNIYKSEQDILHPKYAIFHRSNTVSELYFKINSKELLYSKQISSENYTARFAIHYRLISSYETRDLIDSATVYMSDVYSKNQKDIIGKTDFNATFTNSYLLQVEFTDLNRNITAKNFLNVDKLDHATRQNFLVLSQETKTPLFRDYVEKNERVLIRYRREGTRFFVRYYHREFPLPYPPYSLSNQIPFDYRADSLFSIMPMENDTMGFIFNKPGFYHIQSDTSTKDGLTLFRFNDDFPYIKKPAQLLLPLRYLTSKQEYDAMDSYKNVKTAVDSFWVYAGGSHDRARDLVKKFYNRVQRSNEYFSSYVEGWHTDRGLIYIVYGPPNIVYKNSDSENWVYGEEKNFNSLTFTFLKVINPFTDNDFRLDRSQVFKTSWYNSVEMWRQGRVMADK